MTAAQRWHLLTGEYPPQPGGVADYTAQLAVGLARQGAEVHVWAPGTSGVTVEDGGVTVHRSAGSWSAADLATLGTALDAFAPPRRMLVQYTPMAWGRKGLNLGFCRWVESRQRGGDDVRLMFHEVCYPWRLRDKPTRWLLAAGQRGMARVLVRSGSELYVAIPRWESFLRSGDRRADWLPVPSNVPEIADPEGVAALRRRLAPGGGAIVGTFGTYGEVIAGLLTRTLPPLLQGVKDRVCVLIGRGSERFAARLVADHPALAGRLIAPGGLPPADVSRHLQACDLLVQPYPDGVSSRRGTVMAGLAHGRAIATTEGWLTEPVWAETGCVALAPAGDPSALVRLGERLLTDTPARALRARHDRPRDLRSPVSDRAYY